MKAILLLLFCSVSSEAAPLLKALTYNVNGIPVVTPHWLEKRDAIGAKLREGGYDIVALQEAWRDEDAEKLAEASGLPYYVRFERSVAMGTGLVILSRWPIVEKHLLSFTCAPSVLRWMTGEPVAGKGAIMARVQTPKGPLDVYTAHPVAAYADARYETLRWTQLYELTEMIERYSEGRPFLLLADLNTSPGEPEYKLLFDLLALDDVCMEKGKDVCGVTNAEDHARIDHVLAPRGPGRFAKVRTAFSGTLPGTDIPYSDHLALEAGVDASLLTRKLSPDPGSRADALSYITARLQRLMDAMYAREEARSWWPVYGFLITTRYDHQRAQLAAISARAESARIRPAQARR